MKPALKCVDLELVHIEEPSYYHWLYVHHPCFQRWLLVMTLTVPLNLYNSTFCSWRCIYNYFGHWGFGRPPLFCSFEKVIEGKTRFCFVWSGPDTHLIRMLARYASDKMEANCNHSHRNHWVDHLKLKVQWNQTFVELAVLMIKLMMKKSFLGNVSQNRWSVTNIESGNKQNREAVTTALALGGGISSTPGDEWKWKSS